MLKRELQTIEMCLEDLLDYEMSRRKKNTPQSKPIPKGVYEVYITSRKATKFTISDSNTSPQDYLQEPATDSKTTNTTNSGSSDDNTTGAALSDGNDPIEYE